MGFTDSLKNTLMGGGAKTQIGDLEIDGCTHFVHTFEAQATEYPVSEGFIITDHVRKMPDVIQLEGCLSNATLETGYPGQTTVNAFASIAKGDGDRIQNAMETLRSYIGKRVDVSNSKINYKQVVVLNINFDQSNQSGGFVYFTLNAKELKVVKTAKSGLLAMAQSASSASSAESVSDGSKSTSKQAKPKQDAGKNTNSQASAADSGKNESILHSLF